MFSSLFCSSASSSSAPLYGPRKNKADLAREQLLKMLNYLVIIFFLLLADFNARGETSVVMNPLSHFSTIMTVVSTVARVYGTVFFGLGYVLVLFLSQKENLYIMFLLMLPVVAMYALYKVFFCWIRWEAVPGAIARFFLAVFRAIYHPIFRANSFLKRYLQVGLHYSSDRLGGEEFIPCEPNYVYLCQSLEISLYFPKSDQRVTVHAQCLLKTLKTSWWIVAAYFLYFWHATIRTCILLLVMALVLPVFTKHESKWSFGMRRELNYQKRARENRSLVIL